MAFRREIRVRKKQWSIIVDVRHKRGGETPNGNACRIAVPASCRLRLVQTHRCVGLQLGCHHVRPSTLCSWGQSAFLAFPVKDVNERVVRSIKMLGPTSTNLWTSFATSMASLRRVIFLGVSRQSMVRIWNSGSQLSPGSVPQADSPGTPGVRIPATI